ncbi:MAG: hypothetical protein ACM3H8_01290 [Sphingobacteriales bacterium]
MRLFLAIALLITSAVHGQKKIFELAKLDSANFGKFIEDKKVIVVGEVHGTTEVPQFVLQLAKLLKKKTGQVTIALEISSNYQADIDNFLEHGDFEKLKELDYFKYPDGRTSVAVGELIKGLREIGGVRIICFDVEWGTANTATRDSLMGLNLSKKYRNERMIVLTGNIHANLMEGYWRSGFKSAIYYFKEINGLENNLISLNTYFGGGTIWNCMQDGCKERDAGGSPLGSEYDGLTKFIEIYGDKNTDGYSGFVYFNRVTVSKPLVQ